MRPFKKARLENSPGAAGRTPATDNIAVSTAARTDAPPWTCSSNISSPLKLPGPGSQITIA